MTKQPKNSKGTIAGMPLLRTDDKLKRIAWVGIDEESDDQSTRRFDLEILREVIYTSGVELIREFEQDQIMDIL
ncbi:hypothetical protein Aduo_015610 [Ancylostoma duodenale]